MDNKSNLCLVTALYDIKRGDLPSDGFGRTFENYLESFKELLKVNYNLLVFCDESLNTFVQNNAKYPDKVRIVNKSLEAIKTQYFPWFDKVQQIRTNPDWKNQSGWMPDSPQSRLEFYSIITFLKQWLVHDASLYNHFDAKYYAWIDAGIAKTCNPTYYLTEDFEQKLINKLSDGKLLYLAFPYQADAPEVHGFTKSKLNDYAGTVTEYVCRGGFWAGHKDVIHEINDIYYNLLNDTLNNNLMGTEESIYTILSYQHKDKINVHMIESNGLVYKFFEDLRNDVIIPKSEKLALYFLVFNTPKQFEITVKSWKDNYPDIFEKSKKYVVNNSNDPDPSINEQYRKMFIENNMQEYKFDNIGITSGRQWVAEHFNASDHQYYVFIEEDMLAYPKDNNVQLCQSGFQRYHEGLFEKSIHILESEKLDFLRLTFSEFFGDCAISWSEINNSREHKDKFYPPKEGYVETKKYQPNSLNTPKVIKLGIWKNLPYSIGNYHYSNWPILFNKSGNKKYFWIPLGLIYVSKYLCHKQVFCGKRAN